jgi:hypothetical protein
MEHLVHLFEALWLLFLVKNLEKLAPSDSFLLTVGKSPFEELNSLRRQIARVSFQDRTDRYGLDTPQKFRLIPGLPGRISKKHFIKYNPKRPYITLRRILRPL